MQRRPKRVGPYCRSQFSTLFLLLSDGTLKSRKIKQLDLDKEELFLNRTALINKKIRQISNIDLDLQFLKEKLEEQFEYLERLVQSTDPSFKGAFFRWTPSTDGCDRWTPP